MKSKYDVVILGGGLAGLSLSIQLKRSNPNISILVIEKSNNAAPTAAHKVGESTVELASHYFRNVLGLKDYLEEHELPKHGLRFFFKNNTKEEISSRVELGPRNWLVVPSHQLDRGTLENYMTKHSQELGNTVISGGSVRNVEFGEDVHTVTYKLNDEEHQVTARWVSDASGRAGILKRKLDFAKPTDHAANAVWWRVKGVIDIDDWSDNQEWKNHLEPKLRYLSTVHFMDKGYWLWVIPLGSKNTSIGIVADPAVHPLNTYNTYEKAIEWVRVNEPRAYKFLEPMRENVLDFLQLKHYSHHTGRVFSAQDRWGVTGEAGAFLDPFYSPGSDFISLCNTWLSDLILRDLEGEDISLRARVYEHAYLTQVNNWLPVYQDKYLLMGSAQIMTVKILWDWAVYWSVHCLLFTNKGFTDMTVLKKLFGAEDGIGNKLGQLNARMQQTFLDWLPYENEVFSNRYIDPYDLMYMREFQVGLEKIHENEQSLLDKVSENMSKLEQIAVAIFRLIASQAKGTPKDLAINPYTFSLEEATTAVVKPEETIEPAQNIIDDVQVMWFYKEKELA